MEPPNRDTEGHPVEEGSSSRVQIGARIREALWARFGEDGLVLASEKLGIPTQTMLNYEAGAAMPSETFLRFLVLTGANPAWLLNGRGPRFVRSRLRLNGPVRAGGDSEEKGPAETKEPDG